MGTIEYHSKELAAVSIKTTPSDKVTGGGGAAAAALV